MFTRKCCGWIIGFCLIVFITPVVQADELFELKERLRIIEEEKQDLIQEIRKLEAKDNVEDEKIQESAVSKVTPPPEDKPYKTNVALKLYWDTREYNTFEIATSSTGLPLGFTFWGFTDLHGNQDQVGDSFDFDRFFMEYRLSRAFDPEWVLGIKGLGYQMEYNDTNGSGNQLVRFGLTYKHGIPSIIEKEGWLQLRAFPYESDGSGQQMSLIYYFPLHERIWISGFVDLNLREGADDRWVIEPQLNIKLNDRYTFLVEYRYSGSDDASATLDGDGVAFGMSMGF